MKKIVYYITDHGLGHATRSVALIRELQKNNLEIIIRNSNARTFLKQSLPGTKIISAITDVGPIIKNDGISIDVKKSKPILKKWIDKIEKNAELEFIYVQKINPNLIISDISSMPLLAANKLGISSIAISNFSWFDVLKFIPNNQLNKLLEIYNLANYAIQLSYGTKMNNFKKKKKVGLISRTLTKSKQQIKKDLGINQSDRVVLMALGGTKQKIKCKIDKSTKILSMNSIVQDGDNVKDVSNWIEGQNLVAISDLVICKCGYGLISECLSNGIPFFYLSDIKHIEQKAISNELNKQKLGKKMSFKEINNLNINNKLFSKLSKVQKKPIENKKVTRLILEFIKN